MPGRIAHPSPSKVRNSASLCRARPSPLRPQLTGTIHDLDVSIDLPSGCDFYCYYGPSSPPAVIENLGGNQFLAISGQITARVGRTSITGTLTVSSH